MISFSEWRKRQDETFRLSPSMVDDEGDGLDNLVPKLITPSHPGAMPVYSQSDLPPTVKNGGKRGSKPAFSKKK